MYLLHDCTQLDFKIRISCLFVALKPSVLHENKLLFLRDKHVHILPTVQKTEATTPSKQLWAEQHYIWSSLAGILVKTFFFFFFSGNISSGKHKHGSYSLLQNLTPPSSYKSQSFVQVLRSWHLLQVTVGRLTKLSAIVSELQRTQAFKCTAKEKDLRINRKWWFFQAQKHLDKTSGTNRHRKATGP